MPDTSIDGVSSLSIVIDDSLVVVFHNVCALFTPFCARCVDDRDRVVEHEAFYADEKRYWRVADSCGYSDSRLWL